MTALWNNCAKRKSSGAIYRSLYRVGDEALTLRAIAQRFGTTEDAARKRINKARRERVPVTAETFK